MGSRPPNPRASPWPEARVSARNLRKVVLPAPGSPRRTGRRAAEEVENRRGRGQALSHVPPSSGRAAGRPRGARAQVSPSGVSSRALEGRTSPGAAASGRPGPRCPCPGSRGMVGSHQKLEVGAGGLLQIRSRRPQPETAQEVPGIGGLDIDLQALGLHSSFSPMDVAAHRRLPGGDASIHCDRGAAASCQGAARRETRLPEVCGGARSGPQPPPQHRARGCEICTSPASPSIRAEWVPARSSRRGHHHGASQPRRARASTSAPRRSHFFSMIRTDRTAGKPGLPTATWRASRS